MNGVAVAWLRSRRFAALTAVCLAIAVAGAFAPDSSLLLPFVTQRFPMPLLLVLLPAVVLTTPLCDEAATPSQSRDSVTPRTGRTLLA